ncbi:hypothetical protein EUGRSUZ_J02610 [Eucalyptus grandis]|uniref:Uncharacterized protein n=2 Tax=Eucalyptus grandis TaxID=71139 RepID=A0ACC3J9I5_EUCGR|nr:hypothetical protein EUGRSUZ_J02610 [Eucalyptus grandis]
MGLLHNLWDETVAGPAPESGLEEVPEHRSAAAAGRWAEAAAAAVHPRGAGLVSRRITFVRTGTLGGAVGWDSVPETPATSCSDPGTAPSPLGSFVFNLEALFSAYGFRDHPRRRLCYNYNIV